MQQNPADSVLIIQQNIKFVPWPLNLPGQRETLGVIVALGAFPVHPLCGISNVDSPGLLSYADFSLGPLYVRYELPNDPALIELLTGELRRNISGAMAAEPIPYYAGHDSLLSIELTPEGYRRCKSDFDAALERQEEK